MWQPGQTCFGFWLVTSISGETRIFYCRERLTVPSPSPSVHRPVAGHPFSYFPLGTLTLALGVNPRVHGGETSFASF